MSDIFSEAERVIDRLSYVGLSLDDCADAISLIHRLVSEVRGPSDFETWRDAAISERLRRVEAEKAANGKQPAEQERTCRWVQQQDQSEVYRTECGYWKSRIGYPIPSPCTAGVEECPHCGGKIEEST